MKPGLIRAGDAGTPADLPRWRDGATRHDRSRFRAMAPKHQRDQRRPTRAPDANHCNSQTKNSRVQSRRDAVPDSGIVSSAQKETSSCGRIIRSSGRRIQGGSRRQETGSPPSHPSRTRLLSGPARVLNCDRRVVNAPRRQRAELLQRSNQASEARFCCVPASYAGTQHS